MPILSLARRAGALLRPLRVGNWTERSVRDKLLLAPLVVLLLGFFAVPMLYMIRMSLYEPSTAAAYEPGLTLENYATILQSGFIWEVTKFTFGVAIVTTVLTLLVSLPYAYAIWRVDSDLTRNTLLFGAILSLLVTLVVKLYSWLVLLSPRGALNETLLATGLISEPLALINNEIGVIIGLVYTSFPYAVLAIYTVLTSLDRDVLAAAYDLGATRPRAFGEVIVPTALPGIVVGGVITFAWSIGTYASPALLGSSSEHSYALEVEALMISQFNWPLGAALSMVILAIVLGCIVLAFVVVSRFEGGT